MEDESYEERQRDELEFLQFVFMSDFEDTREKDTWKIQRPPEIIIKLTPQKSISTSVQRLQISVKVHAKYSSDYPDTPPQLDLIEPHLLSKDLVKELLTEINDLAKSRIGEVMMLEIAQHVQSFLHKHDRPPVSLYEEMVKRREKEAEEESKKKFQEQEVARHQRQEEIALELQRRQDQLREKLLQDSDEESSSDDELVTKNSNKPAGQKDSDDITSPPLPPPPLEDNLIEARGNGNILRGKLLGDSSHGYYSVYCGMEVDSGSLVCVYEWMIPCKTQKKADTRRSRQVASIRQEYDSFSERFINHSSIVKYLLMRHNLTEHGILVEVAMEYVNGGSLNSLLQGPCSSPITGKSLQLYSKQILEGVAYLHSQGIVHNDIRPSLVFIDSVQGVKLAGHTIVKRLSDLTGKVNEEAWPRGFFTKLGGKKTDILKLGMVIYCMSVGRITVSYPPDPPDHFSEDFKDFLNKCLNNNEYQRYPAHELLVHPFITPPTFIPGSIDHTHRTEVGVGLLRDKSADSGLADPVPTGGGRSRLEAEFEVLEVLGKGGFGDVIKVRNYLDSRLYAIKKVRLTGGSKMMTKLTREVELLSQMNHENIVRYYNAWIEKYSEPNHYGNEEEEEEEFSDSSEDEDTTEEEEEEEEGEEGLSFIEFKLDESATLDSSDQIKDDSYSFSSDVSTDTGEKRRGGGGSVFKGKVDTPGTNVATLLEADLMVTTPRARRGVLLSESSDSVIFQDTSSMTHGGGGGEGEEESTATAAAGGRIKQKQTGHSQYLYIQMEYCSNQTLKVLIDSGQLVKSGGFELGWQLFREITEGLAHIHSQGMIHRDLKPVNIFLNSSGHCKIGDFGLATTFSKYHPGPSRQQSIPSNTSILAGDTGLVGTTLYLAPELLKSVVKYTQKVDMYSLGIILYEMSHPPPGTVMERVKILTDVRKKEIVFSESFKTSKKMNKQLYVVRWLLSHSPTERPTSAQLLNSSHVPRQIEEEQLQEAVEHTLQNPNSSQYRRLMEKLFSQENSKLFEMSFFSEHSNLDLDKVNRSSFNATYFLLQQFVWNVTESVFNRHCGLCVNVPFLEPMNESLVGAEGTVQLLESTGKIITLPQYHWLSFSRYVLQHDITYLKRYELFKGYQLPRLPGTHPKERRQFIFDIVSPPTATPTHTPTHSARSNKLIYECELISIVTEILSDLQINQVYIKINHTSLINKILNYCSVPQDQHQIIINYLFKLSRHADIEWDFKTKLNLQLSPLALKTLTKLLTSQVPLDEAHSLLEPLTRNKSTAQVVKQVLQDFKLLERQLEKLQVLKKLKVLFSPGLVLNMEYFEGLIFSFCSLEDSKKSRKGSSQLVLARGGQYNKLMESLREKRQVLSAPYSSPSSSSLPLSPSLCGLSINEEILVKVLCKTYVETGQSLLSHSLSKCQGLVCSLNPDIPLHDECLKLVQDLRDVKGLFVDHLYHHLELEDLQEFCCTRHIPHLIIIDNSLLVRNQYKLRSLDTDKYRVISERIVNNIQELIEYIIPKHSIERNDSIEGVPQVLTSRSSAAAISTDGSSLPAVTITTIGRQKVAGNIKRRYDSHILTKLSPLLYQLPTRSPVEIIAIDFELEALCQLTVEINKSISQSKSDHTPIIKLLTERFPSLGKKYITQVCDAIQERIEKKTPIIFLYSHVAEQCQIVLNNSLIS